MKPGELEARQRDVLILDVRRPHEWEAGRIRDSQHIPQDEVGDRLGEVDRARPVITVCRSGTRSAQVAERLRAEGFDAENLDGGLEAWAREGLPLTAAGGTPGTVAEPDPPPGDQDERFQRLQSEWMSVLLDYKEHFGDRQPSEDEVRDFLRRRLIDEGKSSEEAEEILAGMDERN